MLSMAPGALLDNKLHTALKGFIASKGRLETPSLLEKRKRKKNLSTKSLDINVHRNQRGSCYHSDSHSEGLEGTWESVFLTSFQVMWMLLVHDYKLKSQGFKKQPLPTISPTEEMMLPLLCWGQHIILTSQGTHNKVARKFHAGKFWNKTFKPSASCTWGHDRSLSILNTELQGARFSAPAGSHSCTCFSSRIKILRGREKGRQARRRKGHHCKGASQCPFGNSSGSHHFFWHKQLRECKWESL